MDDTLNYTLEGAGSDEGLRAAAGLRAEPTVGATDSAGRATRRGATVGHDAMDGIPVGLGSAGVPGPLDGPGSTDGAEEASLDGDGTPSPTFTQADVDRIVAQRLARAQRDMEQRLALAREEGRGEAERLSRLSEEERLERDAQAARDREEQLRLREAALVRRELRADALDALSARGLPKELERLINYQDPETCLSSINDLERVFRDAVQAGVDARIQHSRTSLPRSGGDGAASLMTQLRSAAGL